MSNKSDDMTEKRWSDITKLIKVLSESMKDYVNKNKGTIDAPDGDTALMSMQILSILCALSRGYSRDKINAMWKDSLNTAQRIHEARTGDRVTSKTQMPIGFDDRNKN